MEKLGRGKWEVQSPHALFFDKEVDGEMRRWPIIQASEGLSTRSSRTEDMNLSDSLILGLGTVSLSRLATFPGLGRRLLWVGKLGLIWLALPRAICMNLFSPWPNSKFPEGKPCPIHTVSLVDPSTGFAHHDVQCTLWVDEVRSGIWYSLWGHWPLGQLKGTSSGSPNTAFEAHLLYYNGEFLFLTEDADLVSKRKAYWTRRLYLLLNSCLALGEAVSALEKNSGQWRAPTRNSASPSNSAIAQASTLKGIYRLARERLLWYRSTQIHRRACTGTIRNRDSMVSLTEVAWDVCGVTCWKFKDSIILRRWDGILTGVRSNVSSE